MRYTTNMILGIDEAGRGPWAGPLVVGAVVLGGTVIDGLTDSKKLTKRKREALDTEIRQHAAAYALGWVSAMEIDELGLSEALRLACRRAVEQIRVPYHEIIIDGTVNFLAGTTKGRYVTTLPKADLLIPSVSAASIVAKVARDSYMAEQDAAYPGYGFGAHVGYGVAKHRAAIEKLGVTPLHRLSFSPLQKYAAGIVVTAPTKMNQQSVTTRSIGNLSETAAANHLVRLGHTIVERNWKTRWCEVDVVSELDGTVYFTEVKHRRDDKAGGGIAAITPKKLQQMKFAAELYVSGRPAADMKLLAIVTTGDEAAVSDYLEIS